MEIKKEKVNENLVLEINGRLDTTNYSELDEIFAEHISKNEINIIVDCKNMDYISSSGLRIFLTALKKINAAKGKFFLCGLQDTIQEIFKISGFTSIFKIFDNQEEALKEMS